MIEYLKGIITQINPTFIVFETGGTGYFLNISITTFSKLEGKTECKILIHEVIREDSHHCMGLQMLRSVIFSDC
jgi:Holliday junction DNA helicase RuvA